MTMNEQEKWALPRFGGRHLAVLSCCLFARCLAFAPTQQNWHGSLSSSLSSNLISVQQAQRTELWRQHFITQQVLQKQQRRRHHNDGIRLFFQSQSTSKKSLSALYMSMVPYQEEMMEKLPSSQVIAAIEKLAAKGNNKVVASDVAAAAGVSLSQARKDLTALCSLSRGDISVSMDGELIYSFPSNLKSTLANNSLKYKALQTFQKIWPTLFWGIRISFGVTLLVSIVAIFTTIFFISSGSSNSDDDRRGNNRGGGMRMGGGGFGYSWFGPLDFFYYRPYGYYGYYSTSASAGRRNPEEMGFLESVFSYIFGDGNPNARLEETRLQLAANLIRQNNGAVTAEQLAPFCDEAPSSPEASSSLDEETRYVDETFVLPIVTALDGEPQVTEDGDIVYVFPELQTSAATTKTGVGEMTPRVDAKEALTLKRAGLKSDASSSEIKKLLNYNGISTMGAVERNDLLRLLERALPPLTQQEQDKLLEEEMDAAAMADTSVLQERPFKFSLASDLNKLLAGGLGFVNLAGALYLGNQFQQIAALGYRLPPSIALVQSLYPFLLTYAVLFNVIPLARNVWIQSQNDKIKQRNASRRKWSTFVKSISGSRSGNNDRMARKLLAASTMGRKLKQLGSLSEDEIVFDTNLSTIEKLEQQRQQQSLQEFDKLLDSTSDSISEKDEFQ